MYVSGAGLRPGTYFLYDRKFVSCRIKKYDYTYTFFVY